MPIKRKHTCKTCLGRFYEFEFMKDGKCWMCIEGKDDEVVEHKTPVQMISLIELRKETENFDPIEYIKECKRSEKRN